MANPTGDLQEQPAVKVAGVISPEQARVLSEHPPESEEAAVVLQGLGAAVGAKDVALVVHKPEEGPETPSHFVSLNAADNGNHFGTELLPKTAEEHGLPTPEEAHAQISAQAQPEQPAGPTDPAQP